MELIHNLALGASTVFSFSNLTYCFLGVLFGTAVGVLPGLGPLPTIAMLLPITYALDPISALIMLAGIYYGAQYGGSTTAILVNLPGESSSVVTCLDGYQMARQGRAGVALATAAIGSFIAGTIATVIIAAFAPVLAELAFNFGPAEYFALMFLGLVAAVVLSRASLLKSLAMVVLGLMFGLVGIDVNSGISRFTFNSIYLLEGIELVAVAMGIFAFTEIITNAGKGQSRELVAKKIENVRMTWLDFKMAAAPILRGTAIGSFLGLLPGGGSILSAFASYAVEKKLARQPERFGQGAIEGVAGPEAANNAGAQLSFVPMLTLGIPGNGVMALMIGAMIIHNIQPGPGVMTNNPALFWGLIVSMWVGNLMLLVLNLPLISLWVRLLSISYDILFPSIIIFCVIGLYSINLSTFSIYTGSVFALLGYIFHKLKCDPAPLLLGFIIGPMMEEFLRRALLISRGDFTVFVTRPLSFIMILMAVALLSSVLLPVIRGGRKKAFAE